MATKKTARRKVPNKKSGSKPDKKGGKPAKKANTQKLSKPKKTTKQKNRLLKKVTPKKKTAPTSQKKKTLPAKQNKTKPKASKVSKKTAPVKTTNKQLTTSKTKSSSESPPPLKLVDVPLPKRPLDPAFEKIRQNLLASRSDLFKLIESSQELERNVSELTFSNEIDLASSLEGREMVFQLASRDRNGLKLIDDALFKMARGTYSICEGCGKPIGLKRLQIMPLTQFCIDCQELMEHS